MSIACKHNGWLVKVGWLFKFRWIRIVDNLNKQEHSCSFPQLLWCKKYKQKLKLIKFKNFFLTIQWNSFNV